MLIAHAYQYREPFAKVPIERTNGNYNFCADEPGAIVTCIPRRHFISSWGHSLSCRSTVQSIPHGIPIHIPISFNVQPLQRVEPVSWRMTGGCQSAGPWCAPAPSVTARERCDGSSPKQFDRVPGRFKFGDSRIILCVKNIWLLCSLEYICTEGALKIAEF